MSNMISYSSRVHGDSEHLGETRLKGIMSSEQMIEISSDFALILISQQYFPPIFSRGNPGPDTDPRLRVRVSLQTVDTSTRCTDNDKAHGKTYRQHGKG